MTARYLFLFLFPVLFFQPVLNGRKLFARPPAPAGDSLIEEEAMAALFAGDGTGHGHFAKKTFYSWTSKEQVALLRGGGLLLQKRKADDGSVSLYDAVLSESRFDHSPAALLLRSPSFEKKRYAWCNPWATLESFSNEFYGDHLLEITLEDSAYIIGFFPAEKEVFRVFEAGGKAVPLAEALQHPARWGAVYHVNETDVRGWGKVKREGTRTIPGKRFTRQFSPFREYIIINERLVRQWSYGTPSVKDRLMKDALKFGQLENYCNTHYEGEYEPYSFAAGYNGKNVTMAWSKGKNDDRLATYFRLGLAFTTPLHFDAADAGMVSKDLAEKWKVQESGMMEFPSQRYK